jgi:hypothetical protein
VTSTLPRYAHLFAMTDAIGLFEHALFTSPRPEHGYCVDDVARGLVVLCRAQSSETGPAGGPDPRGVRTAAGGGTADTAEAAGRREQLAWAYLSFVREAQQADGRVINRRDTDGAWHGRPDVEDCWGRALWGLGTAASRGRDPELARRASEGFHLSATLRSPWPRAMAFAGLGAAEMLRVDSADQVARALLADAARAAGTPADGTRPDDPAWPWPQPRLTYANAVIPDVLMAAGDALGDACLLEQGLALLGWLLDVETAPGHLSVTPTGGWAPGEPRPGFDQQPIEVATLTDACARAYELTGAARWSRGVELGAAWFHGANDSGSPLTDDVSGGCCDGLQALGRNQNQGAESTLALVSTLQHAHRLVPVR